MTSSLTLQSFITRHQSHHRPIALITSGGTLCNLEHNPVRFLDNFSTGHRGATSAFHFLQHGYAVIHLHRKGSASPFARVLAEKLGLRPNQALDDASLDSLLYCSGGGGPEMNYPALNPRLVYDGDVRAMLREREKVAERGLLLSVEYVTLEEYLEQLQLCSEALSEYGRLGLIYLAAAVSDFWIPEEERSVHKIQSGDEELVLKLKPVPKKISILKSEWAPNAFVVSFKLETDASLLEQKARSAVDKYGVNMVIANLLHSRHDAVSVLHQTQTESSKEYEMMEISHTETLESDLVEFVVSKHFEFISSQSPHYSIPAAAQPGYFQKKRKEIQNVLWWNRVKEYGVQLLLSGLGCFISYWIGGVLRRRIERLHHGEGRF